MLYSAVTLYRFVFLFGFDPAPPLTLPEASRLPPLAPPLPLAPPPGEMGETGIPAPPAAYMGCCIDVIVSASLLSLALLTIDGSFDVEGEQVQYGVRR